MEPGALSAAGTDSRGGATSSPQAASREDKEFGPDGNVGGVIERSSNAALATATTPIPGENHVPGLRVAALI
jgi:hypothetical protein